MSRRARMLADEGLGIDDLVVRCGISREAAKHEVWAAEDRRIKAQGREKRIVQLHEHSMRFVERRGQAG